MNREVHEFRIAEGVVGAFDGDEGDDVIFGEGPGIFDGHGRVGRAVEDHHVVGPVEVFVFPHIALREIVKELLVEFPKIKSIDIELTKLNPPMGADCVGAGVELHIKNN